MTESGRTTVCPECGTDLGPGVFVVCPVCRHLFDEPSQVETQPQPPVPPAPPTTGGGSWSPPQPPQPAQPDLQLTGVFPPVGQPSAPPVPTQGGVTCRQCGYVNKPGITRCESCAAALGPTTASTPETAPQPMLTGAPTPGWRVPVVALVIIGALIVGVGGGVVAYQVTKDGGESAATKPPDDDGSPSTGPVELIEITEGITALANSTLPSTSGRYQIENTRDGDPTTAWNSDGDRPGTQPITLTYLFREPVHLRKIEIFNGWQDPADEYNSYFRNQRIKDVVIIAGSQFFYTLKDIKDGGQSFADDFGVTNKIVLVIQSVYLSDKDLDPHFLDTAMSEIRFWASED